MSENAAFTLGNFIIGGKGIEADPNNSTFQHEYGHYIQSKSMGPGYLINVGLLSISSAMSHNNHKFQSYERDANYRAFMFFNERVPGFYKSQSDWDAHYGWNFKENPLFNEDQQLKGRYYWDYERFDKDPDYFREFKQKNKCFD